MTSTANSSSVSVSAAPTSASPVEIRVQRTGSVAVDMPSYQSSGAAGLDLEAALLTSVTLRPGERRLIPTGLIFEIPEGYEGQVRPRSGLALKYGISIVNAPGTIDSDYRGEVSVLLINLGHEPFVIEPRARIAQLVICPVVRASLVEANTLSGTRRSSGGYGSTGV